MRSRISSADQPILDALDATGSVTFPDLTARLAGSLNVRGECALRHRGYVLMTGISKYFSDALVGLISRQQVVVDFHGLPPRDNDTTGATYYAPSATIRRRSRAAAETHVEIRRELVRRSFLGGLRSSAVFTIR